LLIPGAKLHCYCFWKNIPGPTLPGFFLGKHSLAPSCGETLFLPSGATLTDSFRAIFPGSYMGQHSQPSARATLPGAWPGCSLGKNIFLAILPLQENKE